MNPHTLQTEFTRVKPLVWDAFGKECVRAETVLGRYEIMWGFHNGQTSLDIPAPRRTHVWHPTLEAAKAAAQADYTARILAALEPVTERDDAAIREAMSFIAGKLAHDPDSKLFGIPRNHLETLLKGAADDRA